MNYEKLFTAIYAEEDLGRSVAIAVAGVAGLVVYQLSSDWVTAAFSAIILFPLARVVATAIHSRWKSKRSEVAQLISAESEFKRFSPEERQILEFFVHHGAAASHGLPSIAPRFLSQGLR